ncbi:phage tailspike protein [Escherichia coli]|uniref:phage tailspike protein n=1 Tax=Escherichia coli TaxID=562 RepID=UPI001F220119|nr:phage tailspike protein [Escherichia coli]MCF6576236.1 phage tailspike protein [Escherichia coli]MDC7926312.1 phage tailspike protein [Escherichia coli]
MTDITANVVVSMPSQLFTMARSFKAVANGKIYIGKIDTDPVNPENQIQVYVENEDGSHVPVSQPIIINAAGYPVYNGQITKFVTVQGHSMAVYDAYGAQQFYFPNVLKYDPDQLKQELSGPMGFDFVGGATYDQIRGNIIASTRVYCLGKSNIFDGGFGFFEVDESDTTSVDNGGTILVDSSGRRWKRQYDGSVNLLWFAGGDGIVDDSSALQNAVDATPWGGELRIPTPTVFYKVSAETRISKPITITGDGGSTISRRQMPCIKASGGNGVFKLVPTLDGYRFEYGLSGVNFRNIMIEGPDIHSRGTYAISVDESVNSGVYHVRECDFSGVHIRYFDEGIQLRGIVYLNSFYNVHALWCGTGCLIDKVSGASEGGSDQNRFFGCGFVLNNIGLILSAEAFSGSQSIIGCSISENTTAGVVAGFNTIFYMSGSQVELNGIGVNFTIPSSVSNPATEGGKKITGNWFLANNYDIWVVKETTSLTGGFAFPLSIQENTFSQTKQRVLYVQAPTGPSEFDSRQFIFSSSNSYSGIDGKTGPVPLDMISDGWKGYNGFKEDGKITLSAVVDGGTAKNIGLIYVPYGHQCYIKYNIASVPTMYAGGVNQLPANITFINANNPSSPIVIKDDFGREGSIFLSRDDVGSGVSIIVASHSNAPENTSVVNVEYCII